MCTRAAVRGAALERVRASFLRCASMHASSTAAPFSFARSCAFCGELDRSFNSPSNPCEPQRHGQPIRAEHEGLVCAQCVCTCKRCMHAKAACVYARKCKRRMHAKAACVCARKCKHCMHAKAAYVCARKWAHAVDWLPAVALDHQCEGALASPAIVGISSQTLAGHTSAMSSCGWNKLDCMRLRVACARDEAIWNGVVGP